MTPTQALSVAFLASTLSLLPLAKANAALLDPSDMTQHTWSTWGMLFDSKPSPPPTAPAQSQKPAAPAPVTLMASYSETPAPPPPPVYHEPQPVYHDNVTASPAINTTDDPYLIPLPSVKPPAEPPAANSGAAGGTGGYLREDPYLMAAPITGPEDATAAAQAAHPGVKPSFMDKVEYWFRGRFEMPDNNLEHRPDLPRTTAITDRPVSPR